MEPLPKGANFRRSKMLWEIGLQMAGDPAIPYGGDRDMCITIGSGGQADFRPALKLGTGSAICLHERGYRVVIRDRPRTTSLRRTEMSDSRRTIIPADDSACASRSASCTASESLSASE